MDSSEIKEEEPLLIQNNQDDPSLVKKTYSLNTGKSMINTINTPTSQGRPDNGKAMTMAIRKMSLATRGDVDQLARLRAAKE